LRVVLVSVCLTLALAQYDTDADRPADEGEGSYYGGEDPYYGGEEPYYGGEGPYGGGDEPYYGGGDEYYGGEDGGPEEGPGGLFDNMDLSTLMGASMFEMDIWGEIIKNIPFDEMLDDSTASGLVPGFETVWKMLKFDMCNATASGCDQAMFLDCNCVKQFTTMQNEQCNGVLCDIYQGVWDNMAKWVKTIRTLNSFEEFMAYFNREIMEDVMGYMCECKSEIFESTIQCVTNYDSPMLKEMTGGDSGYKRYKKIMKKINWKLIQRLFETMAGHSCSEIGGEPCFYNWFRLWEHMASFFDNTFSGEGQKCNSFVDMIKYISKMDEPEESIEGYFNAVFKVTKKWWCNPACAESKLENILGDCCYVAVVKDRKVVNNIIGIVNNVLPMIMETEGPGQKLPKKVKRQMRTMSDPLQMCSGNAKTNELWKDVEFNCKSEEGYFYDLEAFRRK